MPSSNKLAFFLKCFQLESPQPIQHEMAPREHEELETFERSRPTATVPPAAEEEERAGYERPKKAHDVEELEERTLVIPRAMVIRGEIKPNIIYALRAG